MGKNLICERLLVNFRLFIIYDFFYFLACENIILQRNANDRKKILDKRAYEKEGTGVNG